MTTWRSSARVYNWYDIGIVEGDRQFTVSGRG